MNCDQIAEAIDAERAQVAHEIHDTLLPLIFAASAAVQRQLDEYEKSPDQLPADSQRLQQALGWLQDAQQIGRRILTQTYPPELTKNSWDSAAQQTIAGIADTRETEVPAKINWDIDIDPGALGQSAAGACYRIVVEAIRNAIRHGKASEVTVRAAHENRNVVIHVIDNGSGFEPQQVSEDRFGIRSMKGRAPLVGGKLQLESKPGGPTEVRLSVPADY